MIYFTSDTHFFDESIIQFIPQTILVRAGCRPSYLNSHIRAYLDELIVENWNKIIKPDDIIYHLGDVGKFIGRCNPADIIKNLNGHKILVMGNHDSDPLYVPQSNNYIRYWMNQGFERVYDQPVKLGDFVTAQHKPPEFTNYPNFIMFGHVHSTMLYRTITPSSCCVCSERFNFSPVSYDRINLLRNLEIREIESNFANMFKNDVYLKDYFMKE